MWRTRERERERDTNIERRREFEIGYGVKLFFSKFLKNVNLKIYNQKLYHFDVCLDGTWLIYLP